MNNTQLNVCPNCGQWQNWTSFGYYDCFHGCAERGFATKHPTPGYEDAQTEAHLDAQAEREDQLEAYNS